MRGIILKDAIKQFGFKDGFGFWFQWSFKGPIQMWMWLNITHKPYCTYSGFHCKDKNCPHKHLFTKKEILAHWKEAHKEMEKVEVGKNGTCVYCGKEKGTIKILNPNINELNHWLVCKNCKEIIKIQQELVFLSISKIDNPKRAEELNNKLLEISKATGKPIVNAQIEKVGTEFEISKDGKVKEKGHKYKTSSIVFAGKDEKD